MGNWVEKYRPKKISDIIGLKQELATIITYIKNFLDLREEYKAYASSKKKEQQENPSEEIQITDWSKWNGKKAILLVGDAGIGKTTIVNVIASELNYEIISLNASDIRNKSGLEARLTNTIKSQPLLGFFKGKMGKLFLMDEVDGISGNENKAGGFTKLCEIVKESRFPIVLIANKFLDHFKSMEEYVTFVTFPSPITSDISVLLTKIAENEHLICTKQDLDVIATISQNDYRSAINNLQICVKDATVNCTQLSFKRDKTYEINDGLNAFFNTPNIEESKVIINSLDLDQKELMKWIEENMYSFFSSGDEIQNVFDVLMQVDKLINIMGETQYWGLYGYVYDELSTIPSYRKKISEISNIDMKEPSFTNYNPLYNTVLKGLQKMFHMPLLEIYYNVVPLLKILFAKDPAYQNSVFIQCKLVNENATNNEKIMKELQKQWYLLK